MPARDDDLESVVRAAVMLLESRQAGIRETVISMLSEALRRRNVAKIEPGSWEEEALWRELL